MYASFRAGPFTRRIAAPSRREFSLGDASQVRHLHLYGYASLWYRRIAIGRRLRPKAVVAIFFCLAAPAAARQAPGAAPAPGCKPAAQLVAQGEPGVGAPGRQGGNLEGSRTARSVTVTAIPGVVAAGGQWTK